MSVRQPENFPVASWLCPPRLRPAVRALYGFARTGDDLADEGDVPAAARAADLATYRADLDAVLSGATPSPRWRAVFAPLAAAIAAHALPAAPLHALLDAFEEDVHHAGYADRAALLAYCRRSADPVGRLLLHLHAIDDPALAALSDDVCTGLQLANFWQDLSRDRPRGRDYVPRADATRHGTDAAACAAEPDSPATRALLADLVGWTRTLLRRGAPIALAVPGRVGWELRLVVQGGLRILEKVEALGGTAFLQRPRLRPADHLVIAARALAMGRPSTPRRTHAA